MTECRENLIGDHVYASFKLEIQLIYIIKLLIDLLGKIKQKLKYSYAGNSIVKNPFGSISTDLPQNFIFQEKLP